LIFQVEAIKHIKKGYLYGVRIAMAVSKRYYLYIIPFITAAVLLVSCGTTKNTKVRRIYHAVTSRYNIYYNGKTSFDQALDAQIKRHQDAYTEQILMYPSSALPKDKQTTGGAFDRAIEKGQKAIQLHSIQTKPAKKPGWRNDPKQVLWQEQEEYNPFLKHCWLLVGQGQFYNADFLQASATFSYIARHYATDPDMVAQARIWQARCYNELGWLYEAEDILGKLNTNGIPDKERNQYAAVNADYLIKDNRIKEAIPYLEQAVKAEKNRYQRTRMRYLLGQLYAAEGENDKAYTAFGKVASSSPPYELEFAARIRQTEVFNESDTAKVTKMLRRMGRSSKNKDFLDQVYYALGNVYLSKGDTAQAISNYEEGVALSTRNGMDKAILWIRLGDLYFGRRDYIKAQPCFSGAAAIINKEYKEYDRVSKLSAVLDELVVHAEAIHLQDSLQELSRMPEAERLAAIDRIIADVIKAEEEAKADSARLAYMEQAEADADAVRQPSTNNVTAPVMPTAPGESSFYFYNQQTVAQGKNQFQQKWGRRTLADDWRRRNKRLSTFDETPSDEVNAQAIAGDSLAAGADSLALAGDILPDSLSDDPKSRQYYLQQIPFTPEEIDASNLIIIDGMYNIALIYKDQLEDLHLAVEAFEDLERRFPENEHLRDCYYQVFLLALRLKDSELADRYRAKMQEAFPDDEYTTAIADPNYEQNMRAMDKAQETIYQETYKMYLAGDTAAVRQNYYDVAEKYPLSTLLPKFMFLNALTYVQQGDADGFKTALKELLDKYPQADVSELAGEMLKGLIRGREMIQGGVTGMIWNMRFGTNEEGELSATDSARVFTDSIVPARITMMFPENAGIDRNQLLFAAAAFNFSRFMVKQLDLTFESADMMQMLTVSGFVNFDEAMQYYRMIYGADGYAKSLSRQIIIIPITNFNYETLIHGKTLDEYIEFLKEYYADTAADLIARLSARMDAATMEAETKNDTVVVADSVTIAADSVTVTDIPPVVNIINYEVPIDSVLPEPIEFALPETVKPEDDRTPEEIRKDKERAQKLKLKQQQKERKEKERLRKKERQEKEKARKAELRAREKARKAALKQRK
jgi:tetratricopeptide (TPR) repeat protein